MNVTEDIPSELRRPAAAAVRWLNAERGTEFELTGVVDFEAALARQASDQPYELGLVLCDGERCAREQVRGEFVESEYRFRLVDATDSAIPPLLDPPQGVRRGWLHEQLSRHEFVLLLFYRGRW